MAGNRIALEGACNFRDLGGHVGARGRRVASGRVYRSDGLHRLLPADMARLDQLGIAQVFDLRSRVELDRDGVGEFENRGDRHVHVPMVQISLDPYDESIDWSQLDLQERYLEMLEKGGEAVRSIFSALAEPMAAPIVFHCSGGKDRAGVVSALLLRALGVDDDDIVADYALSERYLGDFIARYREEMLEHGIDYEAVSYLTSSPPQRMRHTLMELDRRWGSTELYLGSVGVGGGTVAALRSNLLE